jgi:integrase
LWLNGKKLKFLVPRQFVLHPLRHTCLTRLEEAGTDAFTIMRLAGHSSITISQRYVRLTCETIELAFDKLEMLNQRASEASSSSQ